MSFECGICNQVVEDEFVQYNPLFGKVCAICYFAYKQNKPKPKSTKPRTSRQMLKERRNRVFSNTRKQVIMRNGVRQVIIYD